MPDCFAMCEAINYATNRRPLYIGKPDGFMIDFSVERSPFTKEETVVIGDRLYTDIASGVNAGVDTICVLSGESTMSDIENSEIKPTYVREDIKEILKELQVQTMEFDAFTGGVELGGLRNRDDIRLLICYILKSIDKPLTRQMLNDAMQEDGLANFFEVGQAIEELLKTGNITADILDGEEVISVTDRGREAAELLQTSLPRTVREKAVNSAIRLVTRAKVERDNKIEVKKEDDGGYTITFTLFDRDTELMKLSIYVVDSLQLETVKQNFINDPVKVYSSIITSLTV